MRNRKQDRAKNRERYFLSGGELKIRSRIWEIDFLRGIALLSMLFYHLCYDLAQFGGIDLIYTQGFIDFTGELARIGFIFLAGLSCIFTKKNWQRGRIIFLWGLVISSITYALTPQVNIFFGILHFLGASMMIYALLWQELTTPILLGLMIFCFYLGPMVHQAHPSQNWFAIWGLVQTNFSSEDYFPLFPWEGVFLLGTITGRVLYQDRVSLLPNLEWVGAKIGFLGRKSLLIYLLHQPVFILAVLFFLRTR